MSLFPFISNNVEEVKVDNTFPIYKEVAWDFEANIPILENGDFKIIEGNEAIKVWIYKALLTPRYSYSIYSWGYGSELLDLVGKAYTPALTKEEAKRYIKESRHYDKDNKKWYVEKEQTIAGLPKTAYTEYCEKYNHDYFDEFKEEGFICSICKNAHSYNDKQHTHIVTDKYGVSEEMTELSSIGIFPIDFEMKLDEMYMSVVHFEADKHRAFDYRNGDRI